MEQLFKNLTKKQKIGFAIFALLAVVLIIVGIVMAINSGEPMAKIRNLDEYMTNGEEKSLLQRRLYKFLDNSFDTDIGKLDIYIRDNTFVETQSDEVHLMNFIIDIDELKISYTVSYVFPNSAETSENPVFDCPALIDVKYPETKCVGMYSSSTSNKLKAENPIAAVLPISVDSYDVGRRQSVKYDIFGIVDEENDKFLVRIIDYGGYGYEHALNTIREKGFDPNDYTIDYINYGGE